MSDPILPTQPLDGGTVIASVVVNDMSDTDSLWLALLLMPTPGSHYRLVMVWESGRKVASRVDYPNIVPAVEAYEENGGDY